MTKIVSGSIGTQLHGFFTSIHNLIMDTIIIFFKSSYFPKKNKEIFKLYNIKNKNVRLLEKGRWVMRMLESKS